MNGPELSTNVHMSERRRAFCREIVAGKSGSEAAIAAGYSPKDAKRQASRLQDDPAVAAEIARLRQEAEDAAVMSGVELQRWWSEVIRDVDQPTKNKLRASQLLGLSHGVFKRRLAVTVDDVRSVDDEALGILAGEDGE